MSVCMYLHMYAIVTVCACAHMLLYRAVSPAVCSCYNMAAPA